MKIHFKSFTLGFFVCLLTVSAVGVFAVAKILSADISYDNSSSGLEAENAQDAIDELYKMYSCSYPTNYSWIYEYSGTEKSLNVPCTGIYKLEVWGAAGGNANSSYIGGYGGYSTGDIELKKDTTIYVNVGGQGSSCSNNSYCSGGYNGGGNAKAYTETDSSAAGGGGATHIATTSGVLSTLSSSIDNILIVAGGGGGGHYCNSSNGGIGASGGGATGGSVSSLLSDNVVAGRTSTSAGQSAIACNTAGVDCGAFGLGGSSTANSLHNGSGSGGGGGFYGGSGANIGPGGGGSGYIANSSLIQKSMYCYNCSSSSDDNTKTIVTTCVSSTATSNCSKAGNGYAKITYLGNN